MKNKPNILIYSILLIGLILLFANSCKVDIEIMEENDNNNSVNTFTDPRDGNVYKTIAIGNQVWMAENLKYLPSVMGEKIGSKKIPCYYVYGYDGTVVEEAKATANYNTYGVLYNWLATYQSCPSGWHVPSSAEWNKLTSYLSSDSQYWCNNNSEYIAKSLASTSGWNTNTYDCAIGNDQMGNNSTGFTALPGGRHEFNWGFCAMGDKAYWWCLDQVNFEAAHARWLNQNSPKVNIWEPHYKIDGYSIRCIKD